MEGNPESERFVQVAQAEDPFTADALEAVLKGAGMSVLRTDHPRASGVEALGTGWALPWFELSVLEENVARARAAGGGRAAAAGGGGAGGGARGRGRGAGVGGLQAHEPVARAERVVRETASAAGPGVVDLPERDALHLPGVAGVTGEEVGELLVHHPVLPAARGVTEVGPAAALDDEPEVAHPGDAPGGVLAHHEEQRARRPAGGVGGDLAHRKHGERKPSGEARLGREARALARWSRPRPPGR